MNTSSTQNRWRYSPAMLSETLRRAMHKLEEIPVRDADRRAEMVDAIEAIRQVANALTAGAAASAEPEAVRS